MMTDLRFALRMLIKSPGFSIVAFLAIALGLGVNTTIFGIVNTLLLRPLPVGHSDRVVQIYTTDSNITGKQANSYLNFEDYRKQESAEQPSVCVVRFQSRIFKDVPASIQEVAAERGQREHTNEDKAILIE
jgi:hypothetical protein